MNYTLKIKRGDSFTDIESYKKIRHINRDDPKWDHYVSVIPKFAAPEDDDNVLIEGTIDQPHHKETVQYFLKNGDVAYVISNYSGKTIELIRF